MGSRNVSARLLYWKISHDQRVALLSGPWPKLLYTWLIPCQDNLGRLEGDADIIKAMVFPKEKLCTESRVESWLKELHDRGLLFRYHLNGAWVIQFPDDSVKKYQRLVGNMGETSDFPPPPEQEYREWLSGVRLSINSYERIQTSSLLREYKGNIKGIRNKDILLDRFNAFWAVWPKTRKVGKADAEREWFKLAPDQNLTDRILKSVEVQKRTTQWQEEDGRFIPHPARWIKKRRWEDEYADTEFGKRLVAKQKVETILNQP